MEPAVIEHVEMQILFCAILLGLVHLLLVAGVSVVARGLAWNVGPRDESAKKIGKYGARFERAFRNFLETFALFAAVVLLAAALGRHTETSALGAQIYIWARVLYIPAYIAGVPYVRTAVWTASFVGILMVAAAIWPGW
ncbi:MAG: MAPEG family protein [Alphaproteobacteria bacterium]